MIGLDSDCYNNRISNSIMQPIRGSNAQPADWFTRSAVYQVGPDTIRNEKVLEKVTESVSRNGCFSLPGIFTYCRLLERYQKQPTDIALQEQLLKLYQDSFEVPDTYQKPLWEREVTFPMNKIAGVFKKEYERKCKINEKGLVQLDDKNNPKPFGVKKLEQLEEYQPNKQRKLEWVKESGEFPFRVLLIDSNDSLRGIYCKSMLQATELRDFIFCLLKKLKNVAVVNLVNRVRVGKFQPVIMEEVYKDMGLSARRKSVQAVPQLAASPFATQPTFGDQPQAPPTMASRQPSQASLRQPSVDTLGIPPPSNFPSIDLNNSNVKPPSSIMGSVIQLTPSALALRQRKNLAVKQLIDFDRQFVGRLVSEWSDALNRQKRMDASNRSPSRPATINPSPAPFPVPPSSSAAAPPFPTSSGLFPPSNESRQPGPPAMLQSGRSDQYMNMSVQNFTLRFKRLELLSSPNTYIKPQLTVAVSRGDKLLFTSRFDTILEKKLPVLTYELVADRPQNQYVELRENINLLSLQVSLKDRIAGIEIYNGQIPMRLKERMSHVFFVATENAQLRLQLEYIGADSAKSDLVSQQGLILKIQPLNRSQQQAIKRYWKQLTSRKDYYSHDLQLDIVQILSKIETVPKYWWMGLTEDDYQMLSLLEAATKALGFTVVEAHLNIVRALLKIHQSSQRQIEKACKQALSLLTNYMHPYYVKEQLNRIQPIHQFLSLDSDCSFQSRLALELAVMNRMLEGEQPQLMRKLKKKNIHLSLLLMEYVFEVFSRNFNVRVLVGIWNELFKDVRYVQPKLLCMCVALVNKYKQELMRVNVEPELKRIFQNTASCPSETPFLQQLLTLGAKYFTKPQGLLNSLAARLFSQAYFEPTMNKFYKQQTRQLQQLTDKRIADKLQLMEKISQRVKFRVPKYPLRPYVLHLYFSRFPALDGIVFIKAGAEEYECFKKDAQQYFIIENVIDVVEISYSYRAKRWAAVLPTVQGVHFGKVRLLASTDAENEEAIQVEYVSALLTEAQQKVIRKGRPCEHFISSYMKLSDFTTECYKLPAECRFFQENETLPYELLQAARVLFSAGGNRFNELDFYLTWIQSLKLPIFDKIEQLRAYSESVSMEQYHCALPSVFKLLLRELLRRMAFPIGDEEFEFYFDAKVSEFHAPRIVKCRYTHKDGRRAKLTADVQKYLSEKGSHDLFSDIVMTSKYFLPVLAKPVADQLGVQIDGLLTLVYSSDGEVRRCDLPIVANRDTKQVNLNIKANPTRPSGVVIKQIEPEVLSSEGFPSFARITRMFESPLTAGTVSSPVKVMERPTVKEYFNVLLDVEDKLAVALPLRYKKYPTEVKVPLLSYVCELLQPIVYAPLPRILFEGEEWNPKRICTYLGDLEISDNQQGQNFPVDKRIGLQANIAKWNLRTPVVFFWKTNQEKTVRANLRVFVNYGIGVFRWERCQVRGYCTGDKTGRRYYIVNLHSQDRLVMSEDLQLGSDNPFAEVDISRDESLTKQLRHLQGKSDAQKNQSLADRRKFLNYLQLAE